jgi:hypothetical protein
MKSQNPQSCAAAQQQSPHGAPLRHIMSWLDCRPKLGGTTQEATMNALAQLDNSYRAAEDGPMETTIDMLRNEIIEGFREVNARIDQSRRETDARIDSLRSETLEQFKLVHAAIEQSRRETDAKIAGVHREIQLVDAKITESHKETSARIDALSRDTTARIDALRSEISSKIDTLRAETTARIDALRSETSARIEALNRETTSRIDGREVQFRWLVGLMVASLLGIAGLFFKVSGL